MNEISGEYINKTEVPAVFSRRDLTKSYKNVKEDIIPHFTREEMRELLKNVPPDSIGMFFQFAWRTGARVTEILNVERGQLDFENEEITIRWLKSRKARYRVVCMHPSLRNPLWLFCSNLTHQQRLWPFTRQRADQLAKKYGFGHCHKIRHSFAINFLRQSESPLALVELKEILGHRRIETTMEYLRVVPLQQKASLRRIEFD